MRKDLSKWEPMRELMEMEDAFDRIFPGSLRLRRALLRGQAWSPAIDLFEKKESLVIKAELPGIEKKDLHVTVEGDVLTIKGERKQEEEISQGDYYRSERVFGSFSRSISLPAAVEKDKIKASFNDGILTIELQKSKETIAKEVQIETQ
jgi:HSP20 family protein